MQEKQRDLEVIEAEYTVYAEEELKLSAEIGDIGVITTLPPSQSPMQHDSSPPAQVPQSTSVPEGKTKSASKEALLVQALRESLAVAKLPAPEPFVFTGDPLKCIEWSTCFKASIETNCTNPAHRLFNLRRYLSGEAVILVEGMFYRSDGEAYMQAWVALNKRYGHPFVVQRAFRANLSTWPKVGPRKSLHLREFSDFLISCKNAMLHIQGLKILDDCEENQKLLQKLPDWLTAQWNRYVSKALSEDQPYSSLQEFSDFVEEEVRIACNPISSLYALKHTEEKPVKEQKRLKAITLMSSTKTSQDPKSTLKDSNASEGNKDSETSSSATQNLREVECVCCQQKHFIYKCKKCAAMSLE
ncbi:uncharacterized protein LOC120516697 [Polypterus senegalus]|uniref:uncharacterized protein LOC120516697 n=1 Tax=Polypterus senegalus TaxID=55291 RepID=UPI0019669EDC|nr:uncharacterized protein LOC120516697 [Polypterus senegalus]